MHRRPQSSIHRDIQAHGADSPLPREGQDRGKARDTQSAHQNSFEAFPLHAPAALLALIGSLHSGALPAAAIVAAFAHPALRVAYIAAYVGNVPPLRGLCWASGLICSGLLYSEGLKALISN